MPLVWSGAARQKLQTFKVVICDPFRILQATALLGEPLGSNAIPLAAIPNMSAKFELRYYPATR